MEIRALLSRKMSKIQPESVARPQKTLKRDSGSSAATSAALLVAFRNFYTSKSIHGPKLPASLKGFALSRAEITLSRSRKRSRSRRVDFFFFFFFFLFCLFSAVIVGDRLACECVLLSLKWSFDQFFSHIRFFGKISNSNSIGKSNSET